MIDETTSLLPRRGPGQQRQARPREELARKGIPLGLEEPSTTLEEDAQVVLDQLLERGHTRARATRLLQYWRALMSDGGEETALGVTIDMTEFVGIRSRPTHRRWLHEAERCGLLQSRIIPGLGPELWWSAVPLAELLATAGGAS